MRFDVKALSFACAILWGGAVFVAALANLASPEYGQRFLEGLSSLYPGYHPDHSVVQALIVSVYAFVDGLMGGAILGWLYNRLAKTQI